MKHSAKQGVDNFSGFGLFSSSEASYSERITLDLPSIPERNFIVEPNSVTTAVEIIKANIEPNVSKSEAPLSNSNWMLIVGCFQLEENAQNLVHDLKSKGFVLDGDNCGVSPDGSYYHGCHYNFSKNNRTIQVNTTNKRINPDHIFHSIDYKLTEDDLK
jgi:hypothetical protein